MLERLRNGIGQFFPKAGVSNRGTFWSLFFTILLPVLVLAIFNYTQTYRDLTDFALSRRQSIAYLAATTLKEKLDRLTDIGVSLATRVRFAQLVGNGKWEEAIQILRGVPKDFPFIDHLFLTDSQGTLRADTPELSGARGQNLAHHDWYRGVSQKWEPYISEVYRRAVEPQYNVVAVAVPIRTGEPVTGILVLQLRTDTLLEWAKDIEVGPRGVVFVVDRRGKVIAHPERPPQGPIADYSPVPAVQKVLQGKRGVEVLFNPLENEEHLTAYEPVPGYGWGVIARQPIHAAFAARDKTLRWLLAAYAVVVLLSGALAYLLSRLSAERAGAEEKFRAVAETANDAIVSADSSGNITYFNNGAERMFGYSAVEAAGKPLTLLMPKHFHDAHRQGLQRFLATGQARVIGKTVELIGEKKDGSEFPLELSLASWKSRAGASFTGIIRDITDRKRADEELRKMNAELQAANKELEAFSYSVSHDLRSPLRAMDGFSRILMEERGPELSSEARHYLGRVRENAQRMGLLIDDLLDFSRLNRQLLKREPVDPGKMARQVLQDLRSEQDSRRVEISIGELPLCQADAALLKQVFVNLLSNALKFTRGREVAKIEIGAQQEGQPVYFVKDNGAGFDMRYADKLFGVFQRLHRAEQFEGTGVGLAIVERIVHRHGGRVWAEAELNQGAAFYFTLGGGVSHE